MPAVRQAMGDLLHASMAASTWQRYASGWRAWQDFELHAATTFDWPLSREAIQAFAAFCVVEKKLKPSSVQTYISSLVKLHKLRGFHDYEVKDKTTTAILRGASNLLMCAPTPPRSTRRVMSLPLLKLLGHNLASTDWHPGTKQTIWAACLVGFFGTARMGELLASHETLLDPTATLTWRCVQYRPDNSYLIHIRLPKISTLEGDFIDIFPFPDQRWCPVAALKLLQQMQQAAGAGQPQQAVFTYPTGRHLTREGLNGVLRTLLGDVCDFKTDTISCHSFRAAIPSALAAQPDQMSAEEIKLWGRWRSEAYQSYTRLKTGQKKILYGKILNVLTNE
jgi:hypothetical protein